MKTSNSPALIAAPVHERILNAAFKAFCEEGYASTSTLEIATRAKVSKRDLYANFGGKHAVLVACIRNRAERMQQLPELPAPRSRQMLAATLTAFAASLVQQVADPTVIAAFRLAIAEATRAPEIAQTLDSAGRDGARRALADLLANAQLHGLLGPGKSSEMAMQYLGLLWEGLMVSLLLGVEPMPARAEAERRAGKATLAFMRLYPDPAEDRGPEHRPKPTRRRAKSIP